MPRTLDEILASPTVLHKNRAVRLLDGKVTYDELIREAYNLGQAISDDVHSAKLRDYEATVKGLYDALAAKNDVSVTKGDKWIPFLVLSLLIILILISIIYARP